MNRLLSASLMARDIKVPVPRIHEIVHGRRAITPETALRLARYFGTSADSWLNLQQRYDLRESCGAAVRQRFERRSGAGEDMSGRPW